MKREADLVDLVEKRPRKERKENAEKRRRQLLDAARSSILKNGLARTTLATVASEAGLSQGVAVFYFKSKGGLLTAVLQDLYQSFESLWSEALEGAGEDPKAQLFAVVEADFSEAACGPEVLPIWFAFWGELRFAGDYDAIAQEFDARRTEALARVWRGLVPASDPEEAERLAEWMDTLTDGYWQRLHLTPDSFNRDDARRATLECLARLLPDLAN
jgi:TetR/AcrR family transcriptional repressor of bet genes